MRFPMQVYVCALLDIILDTHKSGAEMWMIMSFSGDVKSELSKEISSARHCRIAETAALLSFAAKTYPKKDGFSLCFHSEHEEVARKCFTLIQKTFIMKPRLEMGVLLSDSRKKGYEAWIDSTLECETLLKAIKDTVSPQRRRAEECNIVSDISLVAQQSCCKRAYVRGSFLAAGSVNNPKKAYHFEITSSERSQAEKLAAILDAFMIDAKLTDRRGSTVLYLKEGAQIVDLLNVMGAHVALMQLENERIVKEVRNTVNRQVNCETANISKTISAAAKQIEEIRYIEEKQGFIELDEHLRKTAELRLAYPMASLSELGEMFVPPIGKSGVNHRLKKLSIVAGNLKRQKEAQDD